LFGGLAVCPFNIFAVFSTPSGLFVKAFSIVLALAMLAFLWIA